MAGTWNPARCLLAWSLLWFTPSPSSFAATGLYFPAISTKKTKEADAVRQAWVWYREGIPRKGGPLGIKAASLRDTIHRAAISSDDAGYIVDELKRRGMALSCVFAGAPGSVRFSDFLTEFWDWDRSPYIREKLRAEHSIHRNYVRGMAGDVKNTGFPSSLPSCFPATLSALSIACLLSGRAAGGPPISAKTAS